jgi:DNA-binding LytR/AlgR family response regulator
MNILIVEDEAIIAESIYQLLSLLAYRPFEPVGTPEQAIAIIQTHPPDLVILDITLGNAKSGLDVAAYIREKHLAIPFIMLTAHGDPKTIAHVKQFRPAAYLIKPFVRESLFAAIEIAMVREEEEFSEAASTEHFIKLGGSHEKLDFREIKYLKAQGKYTELHFPFGKRLVRSSLSTFLAENSHGLKWLRVHKSYAINTHVVTRVSADEIFINKERIPIGRFFIPQVQQKLSA